MGQEKSCSKFWAYAKSENQKDNQIVKREKQQAHHKPECTSELNILTNKLYLIIPKQQNWKIQSFK